MAVLTRPTVRLVILAAVVYVFGLVQYGYPMGVLNLTADLVSQFINESFIHQYSRNPTSGQISVFYGIANSGLSLGSALGSFVSGLITDKVGRKFAVTLVPSLLGIIAAVLYVVSYYTNIFQALLIGRVISGIGSGVVCAGVPVYLTEFSPVNQRGLINGWHTAASQGWLLIGTILSMSEALGNSLLWPLLLSLPAIPGLLLLVGTFIIPETPPYTYVYNSDKKRASDLIRRYHGENTNVDEVFDQYEETKRVLHSQVGLKTVFADRGLRRGFMLGQVLGVGLALTGQTVVNHFSTTMFESAGLSLKLAQYSSIGIAAIPVLFCPIVPNTVERFGRRPLLLVSVAIQFLGISMYIIFALQNKQWGAYVSILGAFICSFGYAIFGPVMYLSVTELVPIAARSTIARYSIATMFIMCFVVGLLYSMANNAIGAYSLIPLGTVPQIFVFTYLYFKMPETKGKTSTQVYNELKNADEEQSALINSNSDNLISPTYLGRPNK